MWRRVISRRLQTVAPGRPALHRRDVVSEQISTTARSLTTASSSPSHTSLFQHTPSLFSPAASASGLSKGKKRAEDIMPIAAGHEREELEAEREGRSILEMNFPVGPFGTKNALDDIVKRTSTSGPSFMRTEEAPAIVQSVYDKRIVGCPGGEGEDEHDVVWFWLEKGKPHECPVCSQYFKLDVVGPGRPSDVHGDEHHH